MDRWNPQGMKRSNLAWALSKPEIVEKHRRMDSCMLCCRGGVNEAGLCEVCTALLSNQDSDTVERYRRGAGP
jgi:hypothetical protein